MITKGELTTVKVKVHLTCLKVGLGHTARSHYWYKASFVQGDLARVNTQQTAGQRPAPLFDNKYLLLITMFTFLY